MQNSDSKSMFVNGVLKNDALNVINNFNVKHFIDCEDITQK